jgi:hypothetical protein
VSSDSEVDDKEIEVNRDKLLSNSTLRHQYNFLKEDANKKQKQTQSHLQNFHPAFANISPDKLANQIDIRENEKAKSVEKAKAKEAIKEEKLHDK